MGWGDEAIAVEFQFKLSRKVCLKSSFDPRKQTDSKSGEDDPEALATTSVVVHQSLRSGWGWGDDEMRQLP
jgi:hypothetical protein